MTPVGYDKVAIALFWIALIARLSFNAASAGERNGRDHVGLLGIEPRAFAKRNLRSGGVRLQHAEAEVNIHLSKPPSARIRQPGDDGGGLGIKWRVTYILCPDGSGGKVGGRRDGVFHPGCFHLDDVVVKNVTSQDGRDTHHGNNQRFQGFHNG